MERQPAGLLTSSQTPPLPQLDVSPCSVCTHTVVTGVSRHVGTFGGQLQRRERNPQQRAFYFYLLFVFVHKYPRAAWQEIHTSADGIFRSSDAAAREEVYDIAWAFDNIIQEIYYNWRLDPHNHGPWPFDRFYTGVCEGGH